MCAEVRRQLEGISSLLPSMWKARVSGLKAVPAHTKPISQTQVVNFSSAQRLNYKNPIWNVTPRLVFCSEPKASIPHETNGPQR